MDSGFSGDVIFLVFLVLLLFGPRKLPEIVKTVGRIMAEVRRASNEFRGQLTREIGDVEHPQAARIVSSLAERISAANSADNPARAVMALVEPNRPKH